MAARFKSTIGLIILIVIGIIGIFYFLVPSAEEDIHMLAERVLQETIIEDYHVRSNAKSIYSRPGGRKIKNYQIETEKGIETFSFKDSIDEHRANQLVTQYLLAEYSPINPDTFMAVFNEKMKKNGITDIRDRPSIVIMILFLPERHIAQRYNFWMQEKLSVCRHG